MKVSIITKKKNLYGIINEFEIIINIPIPSRNISNKWINNNERLLDFNAFKKTLYGKINIVRVKW